MKHHRYVSLEQHLIDNGIGTEKQIADAKSEAAEQGKMFYEILVQNGVATLPAVTKAVSEYYDVPSVNLETYDFPDNITALMDEKVARKNEVFPLRVDEDGRLYVAVFDPRNIDKIDGIGFSTGKEIVPVFATRDTIMKTVDLHYGRRFAQEAMDEYRRVHGTVDEGEGGEEDSADVTNSPVVRLVNTILEQAILKGVSDIHIEPFENFMKVRYRIDGVLQSEMEIDKVTQNAVITRLKIMAGMDIAEKRAPQDGRIEMMIGDREVDLRVSSLPVVFGEKIVMRILDRSSFQVSRTKLGFTDYNSDLFDKMIIAPNGIILVTGPTGSGKTTTLYATLKELNKPTANIVTVEDPVEYMLEGINQVQVNVKAGMTFASGLRSILRQDPDVIMIGEIRDGETAQIAVRAAVTGHVVLSTMHTNDTASTVSRLLDMDIEPFLVSSTVVGVIAQRLVRRICPKCKKAYEVDEHQSRLSKLPIGTTVYKGEGCKECNGTGYKGRLGVHEIMLFTKGVKRLIDEGASIEDIKKFAVEEDGMKTLWDNCIDRVLEGVTTIDELLKTAYSVS